MFGVAALAALGIGAVLRQVSDARVDPTPSPSTRTSELQTILIGVTHDEAGTQSMTSAVLAVTDPVDPGYGRLLVLDPELAVVVPPESEVPLRLAFSVGGASGVADAVENEVGLRVDEVVMVSELALAQSILHGGKITVEIPLPVIEDGEQVSPPGPARMDASEAVAYLAALFDVSTRSEALSHQVAFWETYLGLGDTRLVAGFDASEGAIPTSAAAGLIRLASASAKVASVATFDGDPVILDRLALADQVQDLVGAWVSSTPPASRQGISVEGPSSRLPGVLSAVVAEGIEVISVKDGAASSGTIIETDDETLGAVLQAALGEGTVRAAENLPLGVAARVSLGPTPTTEGTPSQ
jgi:hypothetical protein